jgi:D-alanine-D-alanine ligase
MKTIAVIFGGRSTEHDVSIVTAIASIIKPLELTKKYRVEAVYIDKNGAWFWGDELKDISLFTSGRIENYIAKNSPVSVQFDRGMTLSKGGKFSKQALKVDIAFPSMHGTYGEDGSLMGLLEMAGVPYVGCSMRASVLAMDKVLAKQIAESDGIPVAKYIHAERAEVVQDSEDLIKRTEKSLKYPLFVKPAHLGSSIGIGRAKNRKELQNVLEVAAHYDDKIIIEEEVQNLIEVTLPIMGNDKLKPAFLERPLTNSEDFFDFDTKYLQGGKKGKAGGKKGGAKGAQGYSELPAKLPVELYGKAQSLGIDVYKSLGCSGIARVDMLIDKKAQKVYFNEVNPLPGGLYAHNWRASGVSSVDLVESLIRFAVERHEQKQHVETAFNTNYLKQF